MKQADFNKRMYDTLKSQQEIAYKSLLRRKFPDIYDVRLTENNELEIEFDNENYNQEEIQVYLNQAIADMKFINDINPNSK